MHCLRSLPLVLLSLLCYTLADVEFTSPAAPGAVVKAGDVITAYWKESGYGPRISQLTAYDLYLCAGGDTPGSYVSPLPTPSLSTTVC